MSTHLFKATSLEYSVVSTFKFRRLKLEFATRIRVVFTVPSLCRVLQINITSRGRFSSKLGIESECKTRHLFGGGGQFLAVAAQNDTLLCK